MKYALLGKSGLVVSRLSFGAMTFSADPDPKAPLWKTGRAVAEGLVGQALEAGVNFFDTADVYAGGESETLLGQALRPYRKDVVIATKLGFRSGAALTQAGLTAAHIPWSVDQSLRRLGTDWIDVLIAHCEDPMTPLEESLCALDAVVRAGKVRYLGFSNWRAWRVAAALEIQKANGLAPFSHGQVYYSAIGRDLEVEILPMMRAYGLGLTIWSPLAGGYLSGKYGGGASPADGRLSSFEFLPIDPEQGARLVGELKAVADAHGRTPAQVALAWLLAKPEVTSVILGASKPDQLADNLAAAELALTPAELVRLDAAAPPPNPYPYWHQRALADQMRENALGLSP